MDASTLVLVLSLPLALVIASVLFLRVGARTVVPERSPAEGPAVGRPWWGNPWIWVAFSAVSLFLGLVVAPKLFGGVILLLPFVWLGSWSSKRGTA